MASRFDATSDTTPINRAGTADLDAREEQPFSFIRWVSVPILE
jgi:hypothetical protein